MAIGLARMFGIRFPVNFDSPYKATSIADFWRCWHITLTRFFREYVYFPLDGNRHGLVRQIANVIVTMLLSGLWHGANWTFVVWGGLHGVGLAINHFWQKLGWELHSAVGRRAQNAAGWALTMVVVFSGWVCFRASSLPVAGHVLKEMFSFWHFTVSETLPGSNLLAKLPFLNLGESIVPYSYGHGNLPPCSGFRPRVPRAQHPAPSSCLRVTNRPWRNYPRTRRISNCASMGKRPQPSGLLSASACCVCAKSPSFFTTSFE